MKQTRKIFSYQLLFVACYTKPKRIYQQQRYTTTRRCGGVHKAMKRRASTITMIIHVTSKPSSNSEQHIFPMITPTQLSLFFVFFFVLSLVCGIFVSLHVNKKRDWRLENKGVCCRVYTCSQVYLDFMLLTFKIIKLSQVLEAAVDSTSGFSEIFMDYDTLKILYCFCCFLTLFPPWLN